MTDNTLIPTEITEEQSAAIYGGPQQPPEAAPPLTSTVADHPEPQAPDLETLLAEAEQRGYLRGRNEAAAEMMARPAMWQPVAPTASPAEHLTVATESFLSGLRPGVWDR